MKACCLAHRQVQRVPASLDYQALADAGILVIVRLNWGYADGTGTVPAPHDRAAFVSALAQTIQRCRGAWGFTIGNEVNNPSEWPGGYPNATYAPTPEYYVAIYNEVARQVEARMAPVALDPYNVVAGQFGLPADPRDWARMIYGAASRVDFVCLHAKTQENDPAQCWSRAKFTHAPLEDRYLHLRTVEDQLAWVPARYADRPVYVTEVNPQYRTGGGLGWDPGNAEWVKQATAYFHTQSRISGLMFYRYDRAGDQAGFGLEREPAILEAILQEVRA